MKELYNKELTMEISQEAADKIREEIRKAPVTEMKLKDKNDIEFTMLEVRIYEVKEYLDKLQKEYVPVKKVEALIQGLGISDEDTYCKNVLRELLEKE